MASPIENRCQGLYTRAFVTVETVDLLAAKTVGIIGERRMTKMHRYLGDSASTPDMYPGLRLWHGGMRDAVHVKPGESVSVWLANQYGRMDSVSFSIGVHEETEDQVRERYDHPEKQWLGQRRDITHVVLRGRPGQPHLDDSIRIEVWNEHGVGQESLFGFDDIDLVQEIAWDVMGDRVRQMLIWDAFCDDHQLHFEHPDHKGHGCTGRKSTRAEDLAVLAYLAQLNAGGGS